MPRDSTITSVIAAMLLKLSGNNQVVAYFFKKWQMYVQDLRLNSSIIQLQLPPEIEDDLKIAKQISALYSRKEVHLPLKALKTLIKVYTSPVFLNMLTFHPKDTIIIGLISLVLGIEKRFNVSEEAKVPKELLKQVHAHMQAAYDKQPILPAVSQANPAAVSAQSLEGDVGMLFFQFTVSKAKKMRSEIFSILKNVTQLQSTDYTTCHIRSNQFLEWAFLCGEYKEYISAFCTQLTLKEQAALLDGKQVNY